MTGKEGGGVGVTGTRNLDPQYIYPINTIGYRIPLYLEVNPSGPVHTIFPVRVYFLGTPPSRVYLTLHSLVIIMDSISVIAHRNKGNYNTYLTS